ncbi:Lipopolysaccharide-modifying protein [Raphanus sativus]|nr:Lipopolysaccharide-modifying protein [Raphanus sativus]
MGIFVDDFVAQTKTLAGHNLEPTPWHIFPRKSFSEATTYRILQCSYFSCPHNSVPDPNTTLPSDSGSGRHRAQQQQQCPDVFRWIHRDLEPWAKTGVTKDHVEKGKAKRCVQSGDTVGEAIRGSSLLRLRAEQDDVHRLGDSAAAQQVSRDGS